VSESGNESKKKRHQIGQASPDLQHDRHNFSAQRTNDNFRTQATCGTFCTQMCARRPRVAHGARAARSPTIRGENFPFLPASTIIQKPKTSVDGRLRCRRVSRDTRADYDHPPLSFASPLSFPSLTTRSEIVHIQGGQCGNQIGAKFWEVR